MAKNELSRTPEKKPTHKELNTRLKALCDLFPAFSLSLPDITDIPELMDMFEEDAESSEELGETEINDPLEVDEDELLTTALAAYQMLTEERRNNSSLKQRVFAEISKLAIYSKATRSFWPIMMGELSAAWDIGVTRKTTIEEMESIGIEPIETDDPFNIFQDLPREDSGGVFDENRVQEIELKCYRLLLPRVLVSDNLLREAVDEGVKKYGRESPQVEKALAAFLADHGKTGREFRAWRREIVERYGIEP